MIVYYKLAALLKERGMKWKDLIKGGVNDKTPAKLSHNRPVSVETIDKVCTFLRVQPCDIMEWIPDEDVNAEKAKLESQIAELQEKLKKMGNL